MRAACSSELVGYAVLRMTAAALLCCELYDEFCVMHDCAQPATFAVSHMRDCMTDGSESLGCCILRQLTEAWRVCLRADAHG